MIGQTLTHYRITELIGKGGMGEVYLADDTELDRRVAIKFLPAGYSNNPDVLERFKREAKAAAALNHPNIITIHDVGAHEGKPYIVMEHVDGEPLSKVIERKDLAIERALEIAAQIFDGLSAAHEAGVVHRDIKPDNVLIDRSGRVRVLDFGLAKLHDATAITAEETTLGTAAYMSPEQTRGADVDERSDLFSAGVVLYEMVAGQRPFPGDHPSAVLYAIANQEPQPLRRYNNQASEGLERLVTKLLAKDPESRYPSAKGALVDLRAERGASGVSGSIPAQSRTTSRKGMWIGAVVVVVALAAVGVWLAGRDGKQNEPIAVSAPQTPAGPEKNSIAVLAFVNMSDDASNEYFSDGIAEELLNLLAKIPELKVISRSSAFSYKGKDIKLAQVAEELNVAHILEGSVRKAGNQVRITAQLIEAGSDTHLWSDTYDRTLDDIFAIQDEIAATVVKQLKVTLLGEVPKVQETNPEAYALYLQGRHSASQATPEGMENAIELLQQALAIDTAYATAWSGLSSIYINQVGSGLRPFDEGFALAREAADRALSIDPNHAWAHAGLGYVAMSYDNDLAAAARHFERALALEPCNQNIIGSAAGLIALLGRLDQAIALDEYVSARNPGDPIGHYNLGTHNFLAGRWDEAITSYRTLLRLSPGVIGVHEKIGAALLMKGEAEAALEAFAQEQEEEYRVKGTALALYTLDRQEEYEAALAELIERWGEQWPSEVAQVYAWTGDGDAAFRWLDKALAQNEEGLNQQFLWSYYTPIHDDPRWEVFLERTGTSPAQRAKLDAIEFNVTLPE